MKRQLRRFTAFLLISAAALGLVLALGCLISVWSYKGRVTRILTDQIGLAVSVMDTTSQGLSVADSALETTQATVQTLNETVQTLATSITDTLPLVDSLSAILGKDLPQMIQTTQTSLRSAQANAKIIDDVLKVVTAIPFFPGKPYNPDVPLNMALAEVSSSLDSMPASFREMGTNLTKTNVNLSLVQANVTQVSGEVEQVQTSIQQARQIIGKYKDSTSTLQHSLEQAQKKIPLVMNLTSIILSLFLLWLGIAQVGLLTQGLDLLRRE